MGAYKYLEEMWRKKQSDVMRFLARLRNWEFRQLPAVHRCSKPTRPDKARKVGYKAKQGYCIYRVRVKRGDRKKRVAKGIVYGKPTNQGINKWKSVRNLRSIAEERVGRKCGSLRVLNSYWVAQDAVHKWYEVVMVDPFHTVIRNDPRINWICKPVMKHRELRGLTAAGRKARGLLKKGKRATKIRPSYRAVYRRHSLMPLPLSTSSAAQYNRTVKVAVLLSFTDTARLLNFCLFLCPDVYLLDISNWTHFPLRGQLAVLGKSAAAWEAGSSRVARALSPEQELPPSGCRTAYGGRSMENAYAGHPGLGQAEVDPTTAIDIILDGTRAAPRCHSSVAMFPLELAILAAQRWTERRSALVTVVSPVGAVLSSGISPEMGPELTPSGQVSPLPSLPSLESVAAKADFAVDRNPEPNRDWRGFTKLALQQHDWVENGCSHEAPGSLARDWSQIDDSLFLNRPAESAESVESLSDSEHAAKVLVSDLFTRQVLREELRWRFCILEAAAHEVPGILALLRWPDLTRPEAVRDPRDPSVKAGNTWAPFPNELSAFALVWWQAAGLAPVDNSSSMELEALSLLNSNIHLEYRLRRDTLFALHSMPFPLREDFTTGENWDLRGQRFWPIWCSWAQWLCLIVDVGDPDTSPEGFWQRDGEVLCVKGNKIYWLSVEGEARELSWTSATSFVCCLCDSSECAATSDGDRLQWADEDVWTRLGPAELEMLTVSLNPFCLCRFLNSTSGLKDVRDVRNLMSKESSDLTAGLRAEYAKLFSLLPADEESWMRFQHAVKHLPELVEQRRRRYSIDLIRSDFDVLYVGHSFLHMDSKVLPDENGDMTGFLEFQSWLPGTARILCNDIGRLHRDDLMENLFILPEDRRHPQAKIG
ncbi:unnamed protein product [Cladocopium goreaui]|uniref:Ribosomal protein L15 n=1 Tax=Cladocopium goreaui TaxID=2562237 RepID=A0A9P1FH52_9DINO|nr:unnamed protein product [Cladocopium goreaui]